MPSEAGLTGKDAENINKRNTNKRNKTLHGLRRWRRAAGAVLVAAGLLCATAAAAGSAPAAPSPATGLPGAQEGQVAVDGGSLHFVRQGSGPPLILLHGWPETWWSWHKVMPDLARTHTVVAFDLPGLGASSVFSGGYDAVGTARRIRQATQALGYQKVEILSHDLGVLVAYPWARDFPGEVTKLAVLDAPLNGFGLEDAYGHSWHFQFNASPKPVPENLVDDQRAVRTYLGWLFGGTVHPDAIDQTRFFAAYYDPARRTAGYEYYRAFTANAADNKANASKKVTVPVLAMGGAGAFGPAVALSFGQVATDVHQVVAPDSGHWIPEENPPFVIACANLFFARSAPSEPPASGLEGCQAS